MVTILSGLVGGLLATIAMTVFMMALGDDDPPPTAALWAKYIGSEGPNAYMPQGMVLHFLYGIGAGAVFAIAADLLDLGVGPDELAGSVLWGIVWGIVLMIGGMVFWMKIVLAMEPERQKAMMFGLFHLIYGVVLGVSVAFIAI